MNKPQFATSLNRIWTLFLNMESQSKKEHFEKEGFRKDEE